MIFGIGLSRTGTTSLSKSLIELGTTTVHSPRVQLAFSKGRYDVISAFDVEAVTDLPAAFAYPQLDLLYPGSKYICTTRERAGWLRSIERYLDTMLPMWEARGTLVRAREWLLMMYGVDRFHASRFSYIYDRHHREVKEMFTSRPSDLLWLDIVSGQGWTKLCEFLDKPVPRDAPFPHLNSSDGSS
jgi:hypothetical protein